MVGLRRAAFLLDGLGNPQREFRTIHVAGSTGKGSTTTMLASVLRAQGLSPGVFRSPHLVSYRERIAIGEEDIPEADWLSHFLHVRPLIETMRENRLPGYELGRPALFEILFALACLHFAERGVEWAVIETGMGGRLDATNLLQSDVAAITNVSLEHTQILGGTVAAIAREKAAIMKSGTHAVTAASDNVALQVIEHRATAVGAPLLVVGRDIEVESAPLPEGTQHVRLQSPAASVDLCFPLAGHHQALNAAVAWGTVLSLRDRGVSIGDEAVVRGLETVRVPGRFEIIPGRPGIVLDGAHNPAGIDALARTLDDLPPAPTTLIFAAMGDKNIEHMAASIPSSVTTVVLTSVPGSDRSASVGRLVSPFGARFAELYAADTPQDALEIARRETPKFGRIVVTGSMYLVGAVRALLSEIHV